MALFQQRAAYDALAQRLALLDVELLIGEPRSVQRHPAAYIVSAQVAGPPRTFAFASLRPTLTLAVAAQEASAAEYQIVDLVDLVCNDLHGAQLAGVCRCSVETVAYDWRALGGVDHRVADVVLVLQNG